MRKIIFKMPHVLKAICLFTSIIIISGACTKKNNITPVINSVSPESGAGNAVITITGSGLQNIQSAVLDAGNVPIAFNPNFNTGAAVIFSVPAAANVGAQHIVFTNSSGFQFSVPFTVLAVPSLVSAFPSDWEAGNTITITGNYLDKANHVQLTASPADTATIISATATQLVIKMPASSIPSSKITVFNDAGGTTSTFSLTNMDQQLKLFTEDYGPGMQDWSWSSSAKSTDFAASGITSLKEKYSAGGSQGLSFHWDDTIVVSKYQNLSFWVKGGSADNTISIAPDAVITGTPPSTAPTISVPSGVWTHFTVSMTLFTGVTCQRFNFQIKGPDADQTLYFDNVILVKN